MKKIAFSFLPILLIACASKKDMALGADGKPVIHSQCNESGECKIEVLKDKSLDIKTDGTGMLYYILEDTPGKIVVRYTYDLIVPKDVEDAGYTETIIFETDKGFSNLHKANPKDVKMLFGVQCFCRGKAGFYKVSEGIIDYSDKQLIIKLPDDIVDEQRLNYALISFR
ncbi:hypothetical protein [Flavobacterium sp.]|uniref:hypothetical protein n=1 Tax=Flavobacterium sp. TaxID=239 RepID=UPI0040340D9A